MKTIGAFAIALSLALMGAASGAEAQVRTSVVLDRDGLRYFHLAVGDYYGHPYRTVARIHSRYLHPDEIPVVFFIAREAWVSPDDVVALRAGGWSWWDISMHLGVRREAFAGLLPRRVGPPYGVAHGYWARRDVRRIRYLSDREIVDWVNLHFLTGYYGVAPERVIYLRDVGYNYVQVQANVGGGRVPAASRTAPARARGARPAIQSRQGPGVGMKEDPRASRGARARGRGAGRP
jgi:hypothetical protein